MARSQDPTPPPSDRTQPPDRDGAVQPVVWILLIAGGLYFVGLLVMVITIYVAPSWWQASFLIMPLIILVITIVPGVLHLLGHPWADVGYRRPLRERANHPRLAALAWMWLGIVLYGWFSAVMLLYPHTDLSTVWVALLVGFGPMVGIWLFDRRR